MPLSSAFPLTDLIQELQKAQIDVRTDAASRLLYSTDASIYQIEPLGVVFPQSLDDINASVELAAMYGIPVIARGTGSSLAGQAIGQGLILDCSRHLNRIYEINHETQSATLEPGVILNTLNHAATTFNLQFGPDPSSADRATLGGILANNATGAHSISYGMAADHILAVEVVLADGSMAKIETVTEEEAIRRAGNNDPEFPGIDSRSIESRLYHAALHIRNNYQDAIRTHWPRTWRRASGYNLNYLLPWSPSAPSRWGRDGNQISERIYPPILQGHLNLAPLIVGSEGTLAVIRRATVNLVSLPMHTALGVLAYPSLAEACDAIPGLLERDPSAIELIPLSMIRLARSVPAYANHLTFLDQLGLQPSALLVVEIEGEDPSHLASQLKSLGRDVLIAVTPTEQRQVWDIRKVGLGILASRPGALKSTAFIEDMSVPVQRLGQFVRELERIFEAHNISGDMYGHASVGCLHVRPILNLRQEQDVYTFRSVAQEAVSLVIRLGGSISGEHGDGLSRSEWLSQMFGSEIMTAFRALKSAADPNGILNPGKIIDPPPMDTNLRHFIDKTAQAWDTTLDFSQYGGLFGTILQCNGEGLCRKFDGFMCPSFQTTLDEMHSTRGRANLLRGMLSGRFQSDKSAEAAVYQALDLCLACKGCKTECPSTVDIAKLKYEFTDHYYSHNRRRVRDYLFGYIGSMARIGHPVAPIINAIFRSSLASKLSERFFGLSSKRVFPVLTSTSMAQRLYSDGYQEYAYVDMFPKSDDFTSECLFLSDPFTELFYPNLGQAALFVLASAGVRARVLPVLGTGRTLISKGFLRAAKRHVAKLLDTIDQYDPYGHLPVVGLEPSEIYTLRDEYHDLLPTDPRVNALSDRAWMIDEFLIRPGVNDHPPINYLAKGDEKNAQVVHLHGHCYQKAQPPHSDGYPTGVHATVAMLEALGYRVSVIDSGCCGMAGAFGYEAEHYELSMQVGELALFPAIRAVSNNESNDWLIAASGFSCQSQIVDGTGEIAQHPITLVCAVLTDR